MTRKNQHDVDYGGALVLSRKPGESVMVGNTRVWVHSVRGKVVRLAFKGDDPVDRVRGRGDFYRTRKGALARILCKDGPLEEFPWVGYIVLPGGSISTQCWTEDGRRVIGQDDDDDLMGKLTHGPTE